MIPIKDIRKLSAPNGWRWTRLVATNWVEIALALVFARHFNAWWSYLLAVLILGTRQHALAAMGHDVAHFLAFKRRRLNDLFGPLVTFWTLGMGMDGWRSFHLKHHAEVGTSNDPELVHRRMASPEWDLPMPISRIVAYCLRDLLGFGLRDVIRAYKAIPRASRRDTLGPVGLWSLLLVTLYLTHSLWIAGLWWFSFMSSFWASFRVRTWSEHAGANPTHRSHFNWIQGYFFAPNSVWHHFEHHKWPSVPIWNLANCRALEATVPIVPFSQLFSGFQGAPAQRSGDS